MPPLLYANVPLGLLNHAGRRRLEPADLAFFQGALRLCSVVTTTPSAPSAAADLAFFQGALRLCSVVTTPSAPSAAADLALFQGALHLRIPS